MGLVDIRGMDTVRDSTCTVAGRCSTAAFQWKRATACIHYIHHVLQDHLWIIATLWQRHAEGPVSFSELD